MFEAVHGRRHPCGGADDWRVFDPVAPRRGAKPGRGAQMQARRTRARAQRRPSSLARGEQTSAAGRAPATVDVEGAGGGVGATRRRRRNRCHKYRDALTHRRRRRGGGHTSGRRARCRARAAGVIEHGVAGSGAGIEAAASGESPTPAKRAHLAREQASLLDLCRRAAAAHRAMTLAHHIARRRRRAKWSASLCATRSRRAGSQRGRDARWTCWRVRGVAVVPDGRVVTATRTARSRCGATVACERTIDHDAGADGHGGAAGRSALRQRPTYPLKLWTLDGGLAARRRVATRVWGVAALPDGVHFRGRPLRRPARV